jgi:pilus assembly protein CpaC
MFARLHAPAAIFGVLLTIVTILVFIGTAQAQPPERQVRVAVSSGKLIEFPQAARSVFIADPTIADIQVTSPTNVIVFGRKPGRTSLFAIGNDDKPIASIQVDVGYQLADVQQLVHDEVPDARIKLASTPSGIVMTGTVPSDDAAAKLRASVRRYLGEGQDLVNRLQVAGPAQVNLRVRVAEVQRSVTKQLGFNWQAIISPGSFAFGLATGTQSFVGGGTTLHPPPAITSLITPLSPLNNASVAPNQAFANLNTGRATVNSLIDALAEEGVVSILAEPSLTTTSGQVASFLAGGEFPIPVAQTGTPGTSTAAITIEFKQFGVSLDFVPTVLSSNSISIKVRPEVSELSNNGAITENGLTIPAIAVRRAETTIQCGSGQSFAIAGLIQNDGNTDINKFPGLGDLPVLGPLFRSSSFQRNESELVIIVTPYIVDPVSEGASLKLPTDRLTPAGDIERIFMQRLTRGPPSGSGLAVGAPNASGAGPATATGPGASGARLRGDAGFIYE